MFVPRAVLILMLMVSVLSCDSHKVRPLIVGAHVWPGYEPLYLARERGFLKSTAVHLVETVSASQNMRELRNGAIDAAALTLDEAISVLGKHTDIRIVLVTDFSHGADVVLAKPPYKRFSQLKGKRVGVERSAVGAYLLSRALSRHDMRSQDVEIVHVEFEDHENAFLRHQLDALVTFEPVKSRLMTNGARVLFSSQDIPGEIVDVLVVRDSVVHQQPENIAALKEAWFGALAFYHENRPQALQIMNKRLRLDNNTLRRAFSGLTFPGREANARLLAWQGGRPGLQATAEKLAAIMRQQARIKQVDVEKLFR